MRLSNNAPRGEVPAGRAIRGLKNRAATGNAPGHPPHRDAEDTPKQNDRKRTCGRLQILLASRDIVAMLRAAQPIALAL